MKSKILTFLILTIVITAAGLLFRRYGLFKVLLTYEIHIRTFLMSKPILGFVIGLFSYFLLSIIPGTGGKSVIYGWLFGFWQAVIIADCALTAAAVVTFLLSRTLMRDAIRSRFFFLMQKLDHSFEREGAYYLLALRLMHSPYTLTNYVCGATSSPPSPSGGRHNSASSPRQWSSSSRERKSPHWRKSFNMVLQPYCPQNYYSLWF